MRTAISIPNDVFQAAEALAHRTKRSRSELYTRALREYVVRHARIGVMEAMDRVLGAPTEAQKRFTRTEG